MIRRQVFGKTVGKPGKDRATMPFGQMLWKMIGGQPYDEPSRRNITTSKDNVNYFAHPNTKHKSVAVIEAPSQITMSKKTAQTNRDSFTNRTSSNERVNRISISDVSKSRRSSTSTTNDTYSNTSHTTTIPRSTQNETTARLKAAAIRRSASNNTTIIDEKPKMNIENSTNKSLCCDKCDGKHETDNCPYYKKSRDDHPDAQKNAYKKMGGTSTLPNSFVMKASVIRQPGDGSCLFHSMSYGLKDGSNASTLRAEICSFIASNPTTKICDTPLSDWVKWDSNSNCLEYARKMSRGSWGGGIEMACVSIIKKCNVHVYERTMMGYKRISAFDYHIDPSNKKCVRVLYQGGVHYDSLVI